MQNYLYNIIYIIHKKDKKMQCKNVKKKPYILCKSYKPILNLGKN